MKVWLVVQTNLPGELHAWLVRDGQILTHIQKKVVWHGSDQALAMIDQMLQRQKISHQHIVGVGVVRGPGPFTAVRTGLIIANTLANVQHIPTVGLTSARLLSDHQVQFITKKVAAKQRLIRPSYGKEPNITRAKRR